MAYNGRIFIVEAASVDKANADLEARGYGPGNLSLPCSADGNEPATHWATEWHSLTDDELATLGNVGVVLVPLKTLGKLHSYDTDEWTFTKALADRGLKRIEAKEE